MKKLSRKILLSTILAPLVGFSFYFMYWIKFTKDSQVVNEDSKIEVTSNEIIIGSYKYTYDPKNDYYKDANGLQGEKLFQKLNEIHQRNQINTKYDDLPKFYNNKEYSPFFDHYWEKDGSLLDIYSENPSGKDPYNYFKYSTQGGAKEGDGTNREHLIPQSWFLKKEPIRSDAQFVWPTDIKVNAVHANYGYDNVAKVSFVSKNSSKLGKNNLGETVFEPIDEFKGDVARAFLYFSNSYYNKDIYPKGPTSTNPTNIFVKNFPYIKSNFFATYLSWNNKDQVDQFDIDRNNKIYKYYNHVRNPYIDYPDLEKNLYGENPTPFVNRGILIKVEKI
ncbi:endonuclease [Mycoplasmopsis sturni]|uniref:endonuclease n=1 Tax=Mycoplasmopsis sturni TaxID=39047 RepID=UPI00069125F4|nr:endonuclease [Mycoplasmopsis sturni]